MEEAFNHVILFEFLVSYHVIEKPATQRTISGRFFVVPGERYSEGVKDLSSYFVHALHCHLCSCCETRPLSQSNLSKSVSLQKICKNLNIFSHFLSIGWSTFCLLSWTKHIPVSFFPSFMESIAKFE